MSITADSPLINPSPSSYAPNNSTSHTLMLAATILVVPLAAFLAFIVQPLLGKHLLPIYGGAVGTWLGTMLYFQLSLLCGYGWATWLVRRPALIQFYATLALGALALLLFSLPANQTDAPGSILHIVWTLATSTLPAMMLLFSVSPLLHGWLQQRGQTVPYYVYAFSNSGSLAALLAYPFVIEPAMDISTQAAIWHGLLAVATLLLAGASFLFARTAAQTRLTSDNYSNPLSERIGARRIGIWLGLSTLSCVGMIGATHHLAVEIGSNPIAWVGPLGLYLLSFALIFSGQWKPWMTRVCLAWLGISLVGYMISKGFTAATVNGVRAWWLLSLTASGSFVGNALLYSVRPAQRFEYYYLMLAVGGVIGGLLSSVIIPHVLPRPLEFIFASTALLIVGMMWLSARHDLATALTATIVLGAPVLGIGFNQYTREVPEGLTILHSRDLYGHLMLHVTEHSLVLSNETTTHGSQLITDAASRRRPTLYYTESTAGGRVIERRQAEHPQMNVGIIGLGAGTLAAYARPGDRYTFWDIDPKTIRIAQEDFSFVGDAPAGSVHIEQQDGRLALQRSTADFDLIVIDAFSGDGVPAHLLTREAMNSYLQRLQGRNGLLVLHTTSRYSKTFPVIAATARSLGWQAQEVATDITAAGDTRDWDPASSTYAIVSRPEQVETISAWFDPEEDKGRVRRTFQVDHSVRPNPQLVWTDERNSALSILDLKKFWLE